MSRRDGKCNNCQKDGGEERHSFGVYAGFLCRECAITGFRDHCGLLDGKQGDASDLDEPLDPEDYHGSREDNLAWDEGRF